ncbi:50S ribosomal protein L13 [Candidatus Pacearchaeota archaeon]|nr:50S ribosomal protein L13 [Candidatus Pacearchaeota archaeon]
MASEKEKEEMKLIIDATNAVVGRLAAYAAKQALNGRSVIILNSANAVITGERQSIGRSYLQKRRRHGISLKGPIFPTSAERILKRAIRGMLPHRQERGKTALRRIVCYNTIPEKFNGAKKSSFDAGRIGKHIKLGELALMMKGRWEK